MIKLNPGLSVRDETMDIFSQVFCFLWKETKEKIHGQTIDKTMVKPASVVWHQKKPII